MRKKEKNIYKQHDKIGLNMLKTVKNNLQGIHNLPKRQNYGIIEHGRVKKESVYYFKKENKILY